MNIEFIAATKLISSSKDQSFGIYKEYVTRAKFMEEPHAGLAKDYAYTALLISLCKGRGESQGIIDNLIKQGELVESDFDDDKKLIMGLIEDSLEAGDSYGSENSNIGKLAEVSMEAPSSKVSRARIWTYFHNWALIELWAAIAIGIVVLILTINESFEISGITSYVLSSIGMNRASMVAYYEVAGFIRCLVSIFVGVFLYHVLEAISIIIKAAEIYSIKNSSY